MTATAASSPAEQLADLYSLGAELDAALEPAQLYERVLAAALRLTGAGRGLLALVGDDGDLETVAAHNTAPAPVDGNQPVLGRGLMARVVASGEAAFGPDAGEDGHKSDVVDAQGSLLCAPLPGRERIIGALLVANPPHGAAFLPGDLTLLAAFAGQAGAAIANARRWQEMDEELSGLRQQLRAADEARSDFITLVTHELRIPMTSIRGYTDLLTGGIAGPLSAPQQEFVATIRRNVERMSVLVQDLSELNRLESGRMAFAAELFDLNDILEGVAYDFREATAGRRQTLTLAPSPLPLLVHADRARVSQALTNLVSNAHKYTPDGGAISLRAESSEALAAISVSDDGIGISPGDQARLFTQFFRSDDETVRAQTGWGLGLALAHGLLEAQGGKLSCRSTLGQGSTFTLQLPLAQGAGNGR